MLKQLILQNRSYRRFYEDTAIEAETLKQLVDLARLSASGANRQPLKYLLSCTPEKNARIFPHLAWAGYLTEWQGPAEGERPSAYIILLADTNISEDVGCDQGIAAQSILLGAVEKGLGGCMLGSIRKQALRKDLGIPNRYEILLVIALGKPKEHVKLEPIGDNESIKYWRDDEGTHHVPKRSLQEVILQL